MSVHFKSLKQSDFWKPKHSDAYKIQTILVHNSWPLAGLNLNLRWSLIYILSNQLLDLVSLAIMSLSRYEQLINSTYVLASLATDSKPYA
jgi:hypothetical protein